jgi:hypothetical protein
MTITIMWSDSTQTFNDDDIIGIKASCEKETIVEYVSGIGQKERLAVPQRRDICLRYRKAED